MTILTLPFWVILAGYVLVGFTAGYISYQLFKKYPPGRSSGRFLWPKWFPIFGFMLMTAGSSPLALMLGIILIFGSAFFLLEKIK